jgi:hypothetical protein
LAARPDADGVLAVGILATTLARLGRPFHARFLAPTAPSDPDEEAYAGRVILGLPPPPVGEFGPLVVVDADGAVPREAPNRIVLRPSPNDGRALAPAALALALAMDERAWDAAPLALAGARAAAGPALRGWPAQVHAEALKRGLGKEEPGLDLDDAPLLDVLAMAPEPLHGLLDGYDGAAEFLQHERLPGEASVHEMDERGRRRLASALTVLHLRARRNAADLARLFAPCTLLPAYDGLCTARLAGWFEAAACQGEAGLALGYCLGDASARTELEAVQGRHRATVRAMARTWAHAPPSPTMAVVAVDDVAYVDHAARIHVDRVEPDRPVIVHTTAPEGTRIVLRYPAGPAGSAANAARTLTEATKDMEATVFGGARVAQARVDARSAPAMIERIVSAATPKAEARAP